MAAIALAVVAALGDEIRLLRSRIIEPRPVELDSARVTTGTWGSLPLVLVRSGMGPAAMERALLQVLPEFAPQFCLHLGYGGAAHPQLRPGDLVVATTLIDASRGLSFEVSPALVATAEKLRRQAGLPGRTGALVTLEQAARSPREKAAHGREHQAVAVDMESAVLARVCGAAGVPFLVVRSILDHLDYHLPDSDEERSGGDSRPRRVNPLKTGHLSELAEQARRSLTAFAVAWIEAMAATWPDCPLYHLPAATASDF
jgi:nucleoside phosphorylase